MTKRHSDLAWGAWIVAGCVMEGISMKGPPGSTLSAHVWDVARIPRKAPFNEKLRRYITIGFIAWLPIHFVTGGRV